MDGEVECPNGCGFVGDRGLLETHLEDECPAVRERRQKRVAEARSAALNRFCDEVNPQTEDIEKLVVGKVEFQIHSSHLKKYKNSHLGYLFSDEWKLRRNSNGYVMLDREANRFGLLLEWLRR